MNQVEQIIDDTIVYSLELERVGNNIQKKNILRYKELSLSLEKISRNFDASIFSTVSERNKERALLLKLGKEKILQAHLDLKSSLFNELNKIAHLESNFTSGVINKAITGKGKTKFFSSKLENQDIQKIVKRLSVRGALPNVWLNRQSNSLLNKFNDIVNQAWENSENTGSLAQKIKGSRFYNYKDGITAVGVNQSNALTKTSISAVSSKVREQSHVMNEDVIRGVQQISILDNKTTDICISRASEIWELIEGEWVGNRGHEYLPIPLHFGCRSFYVPLMKKISEIPLAKQKLVLEPKTLSKRPNDLRYKDPDKWLKKQPISVQKNIMGALFALWRANKVGVRDVLTQKNRVRGVKELLSIFSKEDKLLETIPQLKTLKPLNANKIVKGKYKAEVEKTSSAEFLGLEKGLIKGIVNDKQKDKVGRLLINVSPEDLEYKKGFKPKDIGQMLGSQENRIAFYNHMAKRFERTSSWRKGDLKLRKTNKLNRIETKVLNDLLDKIKTDPNISDKNKFILLKIYDEAKHIVGTKRSIPMIDSLISLARKKDFSNIDDVIAYLNNSMFNSVNTYFRRVISTETKLTSNLKKDSRFSASSEIVKDSARAKINTSGESLKEVNHIKKRITIIGRRKLRRSITDDFNGVDLELDPEETVSLFLTYLQRNLRMGVIQIDKWKDRLTQDTLHKKRVDFIVNRTLPGDEIIINDKILNSPLFKEWVDGVWRGRGFSGDIKDEVGRVLLDAQIKQDLSFYLRGKVKDVDSTISDYLSEADLLSIKINKIIGVRKINNLYELDGKKRRKLRAERNLKDKKRLLVQKKIQKDLEIEQKQQLERRKSYEVSKDYPTSTSIAKQERDALMATFEEESDAKYILDISNALDISIIKNSASNSPYYKQARLLKGEDAEYLAKLANTGVLQASIKGTSYTNTAIKIGEKFYFQTRGILEPDVVDALKVGNLLIESMIDAKIIKRVKSMTLSNGRKEATYLIEAIDKKWEKAVLANKTNYDIDGLPSLKKPVILDSSLLETENILGGKRVSIVRGVYDDGTSLIKTPNKEWSSSAVLKDLDKGWVKNLENEGATGIKINNYIFNVMKELERISDNVIPTKNYSNNKIISEIEKSKRNSYDRAIKIAGNLRSDRFYNKFSNDSYGRTYSNTQSLNWQGDSISKGLLLFDDGVKLGDNGQKAISRAFANLAGFDKIPIQSRIKLLEKIPDELIIKTAKNPIDNDWWRKKTDWIETGVIKNLNGINKVDHADIIKIAREADPSEEGAFELLVIIKERAELIKHLKAGKTEKSFVSFIPVHSDGTANVYQHIASISRDKNLSRAVNLTKTRSVKDPYIDIRNLLDTYGRGLPDDHPHKIFTDLPEIPHAFRRKSVKKSTMISQYNAGALTMGEDYFGQLTTAFGKLAKSTNDRALRAEYQKRYNAFRNAKSSHKSQIGRQIMRSIDEAFPTGGKVRKELNKLAEAHEISGKPIEFTTPVDFPFVQNYLKSITEQVDLGDFKLTIKKFTDETDYAKQRTAFAANVIHSLDAAHKSLTFNILKNKYKVKSVAGIHDSFAVHAGNNDFLQLSIREAWKIIYKDKNILKGLFQYFKNNGIELKSFIKDPITNQRRAVPLTVEDNNKIPEYLKKFYKKHDGNYKYIGDTYLNKENGKYYPVEEIDYKSFGEVQEYNFDSLDDATYFFH